MKSCVPFLYHPTTVLLVDDNAEFLKTLRMFLSDSFMHLLDQECPFKALEILNKMAFKKNFYEDCLYYPEEEKYENHTLSVNFLNIHKEVYNPDRFKEISTVIVDYSMPVMNGVEFCQKITNPFIKKVLLTGDADERIAIDAFNQGLIDAYVKKQQINFPEILEKLLEKFHGTYFSHFSKHIEAVFSPEDQKNTPFFSPEFKKYFQQICDYHEIVEYYVLEKMGSFLCLDANGKHGILATIQTDEISLILESQEAESADLKVIECLKEGTHLLCYKQDENTPLPPGYLWKNYIFKADMLHTQHKKFLCSFVQGMFNLSKENF